MTWKIHFESPKLVLFDKLSPDGDSKFRNFIWLQLIHGQKPCFLGPIQLVTQKLNNHYPKCHTTYLLHNEAKLLSKIAYDYPLWNIPKNNKAKTESNRNCHDMTGNVRNCQEFVTKTKVFCRKKIQLLFPMDKGLTVPI